MNGKFHVLLFVGVTFVEFGECERKPQHNPLIFQTGPLYTMQPFLGLVLISCWHSFFILWNEITFLFSVEMQKVFFIKCNHEIRIIKKIIFLVKSLMQVLQCCVWFSRERVCGTHTSLPSSFSNFPSDGRVQLNMTGFVFSPNLWWSDIDLFHLAESISTVYQHFGGYLKVGNIFRLPAF